MALISPTKSMVKLIFVEQGINNCRPSYNVKLQKEREKEYIKLNLKSGWLRSQASWPLTTEMETNFRKTSFILEGCYCFTELTMWLWGHLVWSVKTNFRGLQTLQSCESSKVSGMWLYQLICLNLTLNLLNFSFQSEFIEPLCVNYKACCWE